MAISKMFIGIKFKQFLKTLITIIKLIRLFLKEMHDYSLCRTHVNKQPILKISNDKRGVPFTSIILMLHSTPILNI